MIIKNSKLVPKGFIGITIWPFIFLRYDELYHSGERYTRLIKHEKIHLKQQKELMIFGFLLSLILSSFFPGVIYFTPLISYFLFFVLYGIFAIIYGYENIPFEKESKLNESNTFYLNNREPFAWIKYF